ncbi:MAG: metallophosphoesterase [Clostridia bacterium]|nr:metallophosphoesterase [Clostridia bacterium]
MEKKGSPALDAQPKKKKIMKKILKLLLFFFIILVVTVVAIGGAILVYWQYTKTHYEISFFQVTSKKVSRNIRFIVISDIHNREYGENNELLINDIRSLNPDLILFAGDMVIKQQDDYQAVLNLATNLTEIAPCYGILGNHESERIVFSNDKDLPKKFENAGLKMLRNAQDIIHIGMDTIQLIGLSASTTYGFEEYGGRAFMDKTSIDPSAFCVVMAHVPILFDSKLTDYQFDLGVAGHVHGGLAIIPYFGGLYSNEEGFLPTYYAGKYILSNDATLIISRGLGDSQNIPRINNMPELAVIDVNWY